MKKLLFPLCLTLGVLGCTSTVYAQTLTDLVLYRLDANNNSVGEGWNTRAGDFISNLYVLSGGNFVNAQAPINLDLSVPGSYTFAFFGENVNTNTATSLGINFFFGTDASTPGISARGTAPTNNAGSFVAQNGLGNTPSFSQVASANSLVFNSNSRQITLSQFAYNTSSGADQVQSFDNRPGGTADTVGSFTLTVSASAPEPTAIAFLGLGGLGLVGIARRKRA